MYWENYILFKDRTFQDIDVWLISFPIIYIGGMSIWRCQVLLGNYIKHRFPALRQTTKRIIINIFLIVPLMASGVSFIYFFYAQFGILGYKPTTEDLKLCLLLGFCVNLSLKRYMKWILLWRSIKKPVREKEQLEQQSVYTEFD
jgi:hypothetical protein